MRLVKSFRANLVIAEEAAHFDPVKMGRGPVKKVNLAFCSYYIEVIDEMVMCCNLVYIGWALNDSTNQAPYSSCYIKYGSELLPSDQVEVEKPAGPLGSG